MSSRCKILATLLAVGLCATMAFAQDAANFGAGMGHGGFGAHMLGFYADYLDLSDAQQAQVKEILAKEKPTVMPLIQQLAQGQQQMKQFEQAGSFDEVKVRTLASQQSQTVTELMVQKARIKSELTAVLTPEQKDKMAKLDARHAARAQRFLQQSKSSQ